MNLQRVISILAGLCLLAGCAAVDEYIDTDPSDVYTKIDSVTVGVRWTAPVDGTPVSYYRISWEHGQVDIRATTKMKTAVPDGVTVRCRVRGVDDQEREGDWSIWSARWPVHDDIHPHEEPIEEPIEQP